MAIGTDGNQIRSRIYYIAGSNLRYGRDVVNVYKQATNLTVDLREIKSACFAGMTVYLNTCRPVVPVSFVPVNLNAANGTLRQAFGIRLLIRCNVLERCQRKHSSQKSAAPAQ